MSVKENGKRATILIIVVVFFLTSLATTGFVLYDALANQNKDEQASSQQSDDLSKLTAQGGSVEKTDITVGTGAEAVEGKSVTVNYVGTLKSDGTKFDSSYDRNEPFTFNLGAGEVIPGWEQGVVGMKVGGKRKLVIPSSLAYGEQQAGSIPPNSDLVFEIELLDVKDSQLTQ